jgi:hypothetical protein
LVSISLKEDRYRDEVDYSLVLNLLNILKL